MAFIYFFFPSCLKMTDPIHNFFLQLKADRTWSCCVIQVTNLLVSSTCSTDVSTLCCLNIMYTLHVLWCIVKMLDVGYRWQPFNGLVTQISLKFQPATHHTRLLIQPPKYFMDMICIEIICMQLFRYNFICQRIRDMAISSPLPLWDRFKFSEI